MIKRFIVVVAVFFTVITNAQENVSSPYSYYGIGLSNFKGTVENRSMGGLSIFSDSIHLNLRNPASYGKLLLTTYTVGGSFETVNVQTSTEEDNAKISSLDYLAIGVPVGKLGLGLGIMPYSSVGYRILDIQEDNASRLTGRGGMNKVFFSAGYEINKNLSLGVDANYNFGNFQNRRTIAREDIQLGTRDISRTDIQGFSFNFGADYQAKISDNLKLHVAATYSPEVDLSTEVYREIATIAFMQLGERVVDEEILDRIESEFALPATYTLGAGIGKTNKWFMGAEYTGVGSSSYLTSFNNENENAVFQDASQFKVGGYLIPQYNSLTSYFKRVVYRAGFRFEETGLNLSGQNIDEFGISFGVGLPVGPKVSNVNIGIEYGQRGTKDSGLIQEDFFKLSVGLSLNDKWFERRKFN